MREAIEDVAEQLREYGDEGINFAVRVPDRSDPFIDLAWPAYRKAGGSPDDAEQATFPSSIARYAFAEHGLVRTKAIAFPPEHENALEGSLTLRVWFSRASVDMTL